MGGSHHRAQDGLAVGVTGREIPGMAELRGVVSAFQGDAEGGELLIQCHPLVARLLRTGAPDIVPAPGTGPGSGAATRRVGIALDRGLPEGFWRLLDDGEVITSGTVGEVT
jgi:hypothetical protein